MPKLIERYNMQRGIEIPNRLRYENIEPIDKLIEIREQTKNMVEEQKFNETIENVVAEKVIEVIENELK